MLVVGLKGIADTAFGFGHDLVSSRKRRHFETGYENILPYSQFVVEARLAGKAVAGSLDLRTYSMALVPVLERRRATAKDNCCMEPALGHHIRLAVEQKSCCSNFRRHLDHSVARSVFEDTYWALLGGPVGHSLQGCVGCMYLRVDLLAYDRNSARPWLAWRANQATYHACSSSLHTTSQVWVVEIQYYHRAPVSVAPLVWSQAADFVIDLRV